MIDKYDEYNINYEYIVRYLHRTLRPTEGILKELEEYAKINEVPIAQFESMRFLEVLLRTSCAKSVLEIGTAIAYSSISMAGCGCEVTTIELSPEMAEIARQNIGRAGFLQQITLLEGDAAEILPTLNECYDFIFLDAAKGQYQEFLPHLDRLLKPGGLLVSDNILYRGMVATDELFVRRKSTIIKRLRSYLDTLCGDPAFETSIVPIGDGMALSYKLSQQPARKEL